MNSHRRHYVHAALLALCLLCVVATAVEIGRPYKLQTAADADKAAPQAEPVAPDHPPADRRLPPLAEYGAILERPLFLPDRRPYIAPEPVVATPAAAARTTSAIRFLLSAVIITPDKRIALIQPEQNGKPRRLARGDEHDGWRLIAIEPRRISLRQGDEIRQLRLPTPALAADGGSMKSDNGETR